MSNFPTTLRENIDLLIDASIKWVSCGGDTTRTYIMTLGDLGRQRVTGQVLQITADYCDRMNIVSHHFTESRCVMTIDLNTVRMTPKQAKNFVEAMKSWRKARDERMVDSTSEG